MANIPELVIVGRKRTTPDDFYGDMGANEIRAYVPDEVPDDCWIFRARYRGGRISGTTPRVIPTVYETSGLALNSSTNIIYQFPASYPTARMDDARGGEIVTVKVFTADKGFKLDDNAHVGLSLQTNADFRHGMAEAADIVGDNEQFYYRSASSPPNPYGSSTVSTEGHMTYWLEGWKNVAPEIPINIAPAGVVLSITPTIEADFRDTNGVYGATVDAETNYSTGDKLSQAQIQVRRKSDSVSFWDNTYSTGSTEEANNRSSKVYAGTTLVRGTVYQVRIKHWDDHGLAGPFSPWTDFTPGSLGVVTTAGNPTGKTDDLSPDIAFTWNHGSGHSMDRARVHFYRANGTPAGTSADVVVAVANTASGSAAYASMALADLSPGTDYLYTVMGRSATDGIWSSESTPRRAFKTDAAPGVPTIVSPTGSATLPSTIYPVVTMRSADADDTVATGFIGKFEFLTSGGSLISTRSATLRAGTLDLWDYQTVAGDLAAPGSYKVRGYTGDGYLWSGGVTVEASATRSPEVLFSWQNVPAVVITTPTDSSTVTQENVPLTWTVTNQTQFRATLLEAGVIIYQSAWIANATARLYNWPIGKGRNGHTYDMQLEVDYLGLVGSDVATSVLVQYVPPDSLGNFTALPSVIGIEPFPTATEMRWDQYFGENFESYIIDRSDLPEGTHFDRIRNQLTTTAIDYHTPPGGAVYSARVVELRGLDEEVSSEPVTMSVELIIPGVALVGIQNPQVDRYVSRAWKGIDFSKQGDASEYMTWGSTAPIEKRGIANWKEGGHAFVLHPDVGDVLDQKAGLERLADATGFSYRDRYTRIFARIPVGTFKIARHETILDMFDGSFSLKGIQYPEGVRD